MKTKHEFCWKQNIVFQQWKTILNILLNKSTFLFIYIKWTVKKKNGEITRIMSTRLKLKLWSDLIFGHIHNHWRDSTCSIKFIYLKIFINKKPRADPGRKFGGGNGGLEEGLGALFREIFIDNLTKNNIFAMVFFSFFRILRGEFPPPQPVDPPLRKLRINIFSPLTKSAS